MGFLLFPVGEQWFSRFMRISLGIFWRCKIDEIVTMSLVFRMILLIWFSSKVRNFASVCEARLRLCVITLFAFSTSASSIKNGLDNTSQ